jgi:hypothetical protein
MEIRIKTLPKIDTPRIKTIRLEEISLSSIVMLFEPFARI